MKNGWKYLKWALWLFVLLLMLLVAANPNWVEKYYTNGLYFYFSKLLRIIFGWLPFSMGDVFYAAVSICIIRWMVRHLKILRHEGFSFLWTKNFFAEIVFFLLSAVVIFYSFWGLNYSRIGIAANMHLQETKYVPNDLDTLVSALQIKLNEYAAQMQPQNRDSFNTKKKLFAGTTAAYSFASKQLPFLHYSNPSIKPSLYSYLGNYLGFQGYYNPFSGEAQVNTTVPPAILPFVTAHEVAHQLGYGKESEANFVGFIVAKQYPALAFKYAAYFSMYNYSVGELWYRDSIKANTYYEKLHPQVKKDIKAYRDFYQKYKNPIEPLITWLYGNFLKVNNQPKGNESYSEVVTWLIAYYKKYGLQNL